MQLIQKEISMTYNFFALIGRLRWINRWSLMRNTFEENVAEHSWEVATIAHAIALIGNAMFDKSYDANAIAVSALYHDVAEVITGDIPTPIKNMSATMAQQHKVLEKEACRVLEDNLPNELKASFKGICHDNGDSSAKLVIKSADLLSALIKCRLEIDSGNKEFVGAELSIKKSLEKIGLAEANYFIEKFIPGYGANLDELLKKN